MKVGFTGTREGMTDAQKSAVAKLLSDLLPSEAHYGDCVGSDETFRDLAAVYGVTKLGFRIVAHPPENEQFRAFCESDESREPKQYLERNKDIVNETDVLIAAPKQTTEPSKPRAGGTWFTVRYARTKGKPIYVVHPRGRILDGYTMK